MAKPIKSITINISINKNVLDAIGRYVCGIDKKFAMDMSGIKLDPKKHIILEFCGVKFEKDSKGKKKDISGFFDFSLFEKCGPYVIWHVFDNVHTEKGVTQSDAEAIPYSSADIYWKLTKDKAYPVTNMDEWDKFIKNFSKLYQKGDYAEINGTRYEYLFNITQTNYFEYGISGESKGKDIGYNDYFCCYYKRNSGIVEHIREVKAPNATAALSVYMENQKALKRPRTLYKDGWEKIWTKWTLQNKGQVPDFQETTNNARLQLITNIMFQSNTKSYYGKYYEVILGYQNILKSALGFEGLEDETYRVKSVAVYETDENTGKILNYRVVAAVRTQENVTEERELIIPAKYMDAQNLGVLQEMLKKDISENVKKVLTAKQQSYMDKIKEYSTDLATINLFIRDNIFDPVVEGEPVDDFIDTSLIDPDLLEAPKSFTPVTELQAYSEDLDYYIHVGSNYEKVDVTKDTYLNYINSTGLFTTGTPDPYSDYVQLTKNDAFNSNIQYYVPDDDTDKYVRIYLTSATYAQALEKGNLYYKGINQDAISNYYKVSDSMEFSDGYEYYAHYLEAGYQKFEDAHPSPDPNYLRNQYDSFVDDGELYVKREDYDKISTEITYYTITEEHDYRGDYPYYVKDKDGGYTRIYNITASTYPTYIKIGLYSTVEPHVSDAKHFVAPGSIRVQDAKYFVMMEGNGYIPVTISSDQEFERWCNEGILYSDKEHTQLNRYLVPQTAQYDSTATYYIYSSELKTFTEVEIDEDQFTVLVATGQLYSDKDMSSQENKYLVPVDATEEDYIEGARYFIKSGNTYIPLESGVIYSLTISSYAKYGNLYCNKKTEPKVYYLVSTKCQYQSELEYYRLVENDDEKKYVKVTVTPENFLANVKLGLYSYPESTEYGETYYKVQIGEQYNPSIKYYTSTQSGLMMEETGVTEENFNDYIAIGLYRVEAISNPVSYYKATEKSIYEPNIMYLIKGSNDEYIIVEVTPDNFKAYVKLGLYTTHPLTVAEDMKYQVEDFYTYDSSATYYLRNYSGSYNEIEIEEDTFESFKTTKNLYTNIRQIQYYKVEKGSMYMSTAEYFLYDSGTKTYTPIKNSLVEKNMANYIKTGILYSTTNHSIPSYFKVKFWYTYNSSATYYLRTGDSDLTPITITSDEDLNLYKSLETYVDRIDYYKEEEWYNYDSKCTYFLQNNDGSYHPINNTYDDYVKNKGKLWCDKQQFIYKVYEWYSYDPWARYFEYANNKYTQVQIVHTEFTDYDKSNLYTDIEQINTGESGDIGTGVVVGRYYKVEENSLYKNSPNTKYYLYDSSDEEYIEISVTSSTFNTLKTSGSLYCNEQLETEYYRVYQWYTYDDEAMYYIKDINGNLQSITDINASNFSIFASGELYTNKYQSNGGESSGGGEEGGGSGGSGESGGSGSGGGGSVEEPTYYMANENSNYKEGIMYFRKSSDDEYIAIQISSEAEFKSLIAVGIYTTVKLDETPRTYYLVTEIYVFDPSSRYFLLNGTVKEELFDLTEEQFNGYKKINRLYTDKEQVMYYKVEEDDQFNPVADYYLYDEEDDVYIKLDSGTVTEPNFGNYIREGLYSTTKPSKSEITYIKVTATYTYDSTARYFMQNGNTKYEVTATTNEENFDNRKGIGLWTDKEQTVPTVYYKVTEDDAWENVYFYKLNDAGEYVLIENITSENFKYFVATNNLYTTVKLKEDIKKYKVDPSYYVYDNTARYWVENGASKELETGVTEDNFYAFANIGLWTDKEQTKSETETYYKVTAEDAYDSTANYYTLEEDGTYVRFYSINADNFKTSVTMFDVYSTTEPVLAKVTYYKVTEGYAFDSTAKYLIKNGDDMKAVEIADEDTFFTYRSNFELYTDKQQDTTMYYKTNATSVYSADETYYIKTEESAYIKEDGVTADNFATYVKIGLYSNTPQGDINIPVSYTKVSSLDTFDNDKVYYIYKNNVYYKQDVTIDTFEAYRSLGWLYFGVFATSN